ncbi:MAG TPA: crotonase/enoyl-CoA hydratase family protein [Ktedonobacterales bacterium]
MGGASASGSVTRERRGHLFLIGLNRPAKRNAFDPAMLNELALAYGELERDDEARCGVLFAHGDHFTAGLDLAQVAPVLLQHQTIPIPEGGLDPWGLQGPRLTKPLVCAIQGRCLTLGIELALASDIRVASADARFAQIEIRRGIYPFGGATIRFARETGWGNAMRYLLTGDEFGADEALRIGLVQEVTPTGQQVERAIALAETVAAQAPLGVRATIASARLAQEDSEAAAIARLTLDLLRLMRSDDAREGLQSFIERRDANFTGR